MCYFVSAKMSPQEIFQLGEDFFRKWEGETFESLYAVSGFSHPKLPVISSEGRFRLLHWGLIPHWVGDWNMAKKIRVGTLNAIGETIHSKPAFKGAVQQGRFCVIPVNGFFEWHHHINNEKYPYFIFPKSGEFFFLAGLFEKWTNSELGDVYETFTIITSSANVRMEWIHNAKKRMPVMLNRDEAKLWINPNLSFNEKKNLLLPSNSDRMNDHAVSKLITSRKESPNQPAVTAPANYPELPLH